MPSFQCIIRDGQEVSAPIELEGVHSLDKAVATCVATLGEIAKDSLRVDGTAREISVEVLTPQSTSLARIVLQLSVEVVTD